MTEAWLAEEQRQLLWDRWAAGRPRCPDCGRPILADRALPLDGELICPDCTADRMVPVDQE